MSAPPFVSAVLLAAGRSTRMAADGGGARPRKPLLELAGRTVLERSCAAFAAAAVDEIVLVAHSDDLDEVQRLVGTTPFAALVRACVEGGAERTDSVRAGVAQVAQECDVVLVHDVARPLVRPADVRRVIEAVVTSGAALAAVRARDTIKTSRDGKEAVSTLDRALLWSAQTPQGFRAPRFREVLAEALRDGYCPTDDAALWERYEGAVALVEGDPHNLKLTTPEDLVVAEALLRAREGRA